MNKVSGWYSPSENILQLRALVSKLDEIKVESLNSQCTRTIVELQKLFDYDHISLLENMTMEKKIKYYDRLYAKIIMVLNKIKISENG